MSNLTLTCQKCNQEKGSQTAAEHGHPEVQARAQQPLKDAAALNATRWAVFHHLHETGLPVEVGTGGRTKYNRTQLGLPKTHALDAVRVGASTPGEIAGLKKTTVLTIQAVGRGSYQRTRVDKYRFSRGYLMRHKSVEGFRTGDLVRAVVPQGKYAGVYQGVVAVRRSGYFAIRRNGKLVDGISARYCRLIQHADGYTFEKGGRLPPPTRSQGVPPPKFYDSYMTIKLDTREIQNGPFWPVLDLLRTLKLYTGSLATAPLHRPCDKVGYWSR